LQKTLLNIEGLGRELYPQLDLWETAKPFLEAWMKERYSPKNVLSMVEARLPGWLEQLPKVPDRLLDRLNQPIVPQQSSRELESLQTELKGLRRSNSLVLTLLLLLSAIAVFSSAEQATSSEYIGFFGLGVVLTLLLKR
jgi:ubiquinone biosynthesis protein